MKQFILRELTTAAHHQRQRRKRKRLLICDSNMHLDSSKLTTLQKQSTRP
jgi:hypothetical protein